MLLLAPLGWVAYLTYVGMRREGPLGYFHVQAAWGNHVGRRRGRVAGGSVPRSATARASGQRVSSDTVGANRYAPLIRVMADPGVSK